ncbi:hypothetical protein ASG43_14310 [Aureimonas sp. Leaf454]|uniref:CpaD family pilus assembly protein n=1 Tax=Aureimonas sp. Leaf454 TaxID=1736381 RepID=UPI0006FAB446|nr:CpaD family pilus assembly protein [Aureimonas sp. Leaf454]KQT44504.1 hypothetical protein ASG43_14310 [Aureimonas sp. Leaf454]
MVPAPIAARAPFTLALLVGAALLVGCADRHSIEVGSIPDDYRSRHPIVVAESEKTLDIPIVSSEVRLPIASRDRVADFARRFKRSGSAAIRVLLPSGSANAPAAESASQGVLTALKREGVGSSRVLVQSYDATGLQGPAPIRLSYATLTAQTEPCGRWPEDLGSTHENKNYFNFGCASQQNLAAQIADPRDLLGPRGEGEIDAERRTVVLDDYRQGRVTASDRPPSEITYDP